MPATVVMKTPWSVAVVVAALVSVIAAVAPAWALDPIRLVKDIGTETAGSGIRQLGVRVGDQVFFAAATLSQGEELWKTDGTQAGTVLVKDLNPGSASSRPVALTDVNGTLFFFTYNNWVNPVYGGFQLWSSDGTEDGTRSIAEFGRPGSPAYYYQPKVVGVANDLVFFAAYDEEHGYELWRSDGTEGGTSLVKDIVPGRYGSLQGGPTPVPSAEMGGLLYFAAGSYGGALFKTDGTEEGTVEVKNFAPLGATYPLRDFVNGGGVLYFSGALRVEDEDGQTIESFGQELWRSDGTEAGTVMIRDIQPGEEGSGPAQLAYLQGTLFFQAFENQVWKSDGTEAGTVRVKEIPATAPRHSRPRYFMESGGTIFFYATDDRGGELWKTDGTEANTVLVKDIYPGSTYGISDRGLATLTDVNATLLFFANDGVHGCELWESDGTEAGTVLVRDIYPGPSASCGLTPETPRPQLEGKLFFHASDGTHGLEVWKTDGSEAGTVLVRDIATGTVGSSPRPWVALGDALIFQAGTAEIGTELWKTDGTEGGTVLIKDIHPEGSSAAQNPKVLQDRLYFSADDGTHGSELWVSDGTESGTGMVKDIHPEGDSSPGELEILRDRLYFGASDGTHGYELWSSDGTAEGTSMVAEVGTFVDHVSVLGGRLLFTADDGIHGQELWSSDGTEAGTGLVRDINPLNPEGGTFPTEVLVMGDRLYFAADDFAHGKELWVSDGTEAGTSMVKDIRPDGGSSPRLADVTDDRIYFSADDGIHGRELWVSDGTEAGTVLVKDLNPEGGSGFFFYSHTSGEIDYGRIHTEVIGSRMYFAADDGTHGWELWVTDGTESGTYLVKDITSEPQEPVNLFPPQVLTAQEGNLFFFKDDGVHGYELWISDGTEAGTTMVRDINPGPASGIPENLWVMYGIDGAVLLPADDGVHGLEPWASDGTEQGTSLIQDVMPGPGSSLWSWSAGPPRLWHFGPGNTVYMSAQTEEHGEELRALDLCQILELSVLDPDNDRLWNACDNCPATSNPGQEDFDQDGIGDDCETGAVLADANLSKRVDGFDLAAVSRALGAQENEDRYDPAVDFNHDGIVEGLDVDLLSRHFGQATE